MNIWQVLFEDVLIGVNLKFSVNPSLKGQVDKNVTLRKITQFHLISWCKNFVEKHIFRIVLGESLRSIQTLAFPQNVHTWKLGEITVSYTVLQQNLSKLFISKSSGSSKKLLL